ncbi:3D-(3,5/4)-trihydroxycyclohexane-1,2-dione acylhydrolase (decyclizing) [Thermosporothrix hazakensis]|uniref:3D-(3,5/4)-trihydroxycyclohexane-1,2-dione acylhydrolase (Decyclizing) n=1 Tax=Thermosporothrix hazakensis TaxID=644383 RepID=A0A326UF93_THEHA|nr:3D-(3,5/4)-trihydroxycyclohexane-1,2-dione acylhydrolase (decyclizing) [Thermosporothrix hazakensis]PZW29283.1 3D-(3,5/4)-trihydroxycyclohexane-1,2-dione acylhydrolase (decyclizing) [Thermosporothrix hazakensis]GCE45364.1 3D-(3,5/4)-trihydroxycyclohexane-1,2-dione acylhydrolase [Thermosporothrix hazakensis]
MTSGDTQRLTMAQALIAFLKNQHVERDGNIQPFFAGCFGIFGHGNVGGIGQALQQMPDFRYYLARNEQAMVHTATAFARTKNRLQTFACTSSIGPGATNMLTGAATATINRVPVLLLPGDIFARRNVAPVLQQLESSQTQDISVNDCFKPVSRYWDRIVRPEQLLTALPEALRVLTDPAETGAVTLALPQDVQAEAYDYPRAFFQRRVWHIPRNRPDKARLEQAAALIRQSQRPLIIAGGGVIYSEACELLQRLLEQTGIPLGETMAGKGSVPFNHPLMLGAIGATGTFAANRVARQADLIIGIGTRYSDFTTSSKTAFQCPEVRFVNINVTAFDAGKHAGLALVGDARVTLEELLPLLDGYHVDEGYRAQVEQLHQEWEAEVERIYAIRHTPLPSQGELIGAVNELSSPEAIMVCAAGSLPGDLHKLWRARHPKNYHLEYGYSCMGYEIAGGLGAKMAAPEREVYVLVGDGSYLMMNSEIVTSVQEGYKLIIVLIDNQGFKSIGSLSRSLGQDGFGTRYVYPRDGVLPGDSTEGVQTLPVDLAANARSLGAHVIECKTYDDVTAALKQAQASEQTTVIYVQSDRYQAVPGYESWWDVPVAEVSDMSTVQQAYADWAEQRARERYFFNAP